MDGKEASGVDAMSNEQLAIYMSAKIDQLDAAIDEAYEQLQEKVGEARKNILGKDYIAVDALDGLRNYREQLKTEYDILLGATK
jgi:predicted GNAT superfamily acetyltransferase